MQRSEIYIVGDELLKAETDSDLFRAAAAGESIRRFLSQKADPNRINCQNKSELFGQLSEDLQLPAQLFQQTPLTAAVQLCIPKLAFSSANSRFSGCHEPVSKILEPICMLLEAGAKVDLVGLNMPSALHLAVENDQIQLVETLLAASADVSQTCGPVPEECRHVCTSVYHSKRKHAFPHRLSRLMLDESADKVTALWIACRRGNDHIVQILLGARADVNQPIASSEPEPGPAEGEAEENTPKSVPRYLDLRGSTPLIAASYFGNNSTIDLLLAAKASVDCMPNCTTGPLLAAIHGTMSFIEAELEVAEQNVEALYTKHATEVPHSSTMHLHNSC